MKKLNIMYIFNYLITGVAFAAIFVAIAMLINFGMTELLKNFIVWMIGGGILGLLSLIYEKEQLSTLGATLIHAPLTCLTALICGWICGYGDGSILLLVARMIPFIIGIYIIVHVILYLLRRASVNHINQQLNK